MTHGQYVFVSYALTAVVLGGIGLWLWLDRRARLAELKRLEERACAAAPKADGISDDRHCAKSPGP
jgi:heme exporter protein D